MVDANSTSVQVGIMSSRPNCLFEHGENDEYILQKQDTTRAKWVRRHEHSEIM